MDDIRPDWKVYDRGVVETGAAETQDAYNTQKEYRYAGFWLRFLATFIDFIVLSAVSAVSFDLIRRAQGIDPMELSWVDIPELIVGVAYYVIMTVVYGQTLGKMIVGIKVIPQDGGDNTWGNILFREVVGKALSALILMIGFLMAGFDRKNRALHDRMAGTLVVKVR